jgi:hypothetical protein
MSSNLYFEITTKLDSIHNKFKIVDDKISKIEEKIQPMRGEITKVYLQEAILSEEDILDTYFKCENQNKATDNIIFDWSNVFIDSYLAEFKRKSNGLCTGKLKIYRI